MTMYLQDTSYGQPAFLYMATSGITITASSTKSGYAAANLLQPEELLGWMPSSASGSHTLTLDFGAGEQCDSLAVLGKDMIDSSLALSGSNDNSNWTTIQAATLITREPAVYFLFASATWRYWRLTLTNLSSVTTLYHLSEGMRQELPFLGDGCTPYSSGAEATDLISPAGLWLGTVQQRTMAKFDLPFGQVFTPELEVFNRWAAACVDVRRPFFLVPDLSVPDVYFSWTDPGYKFGPKYRNGMPDIGNIKLNARVSL
jgi:hypothetical protein